MDRSLPPTPTEPVHPSRPNSHRHVLTRSFSNPSLINNDGDHHLREPESSSSDPILPLASMSDAHDKRTPWKMPSLPHIDPLSHPMAQPATLTPPSSLSFEPPPLPFKGMTLSVAEWTLTSSDLQEIVSRAIRLSSRESYIRLLALSTIDDILPKEIIRLNTLKMVTQSKYKFYVHRRTMLLQALNSISLNNVSPGASPLHPHGDAGVHQNTEPPVSVISNLTCQLSETTAALDLLAADLITVASHQAQIAALASTHWGSALAIALRKLNSSFSKRTQELKDARQRISMLEAEVTEAWSEADRLADEMDALEKFADGIQVKRESRQLPHVPETTRDDDCHSSSSSEDSHRHPESDNTEHLTVRVDAEDITDLYNYADEAIIGTANVVSVPQSLRALSEPTTPAFPTTPTRHGQSEKSPTQSEPVRRPLSLVLLSPRPRKQSTDANSVHSTPSVSSRRARVSAAKKRSSRASLASLRLPVHSRKGSRAGSSHGHGTPPLPTRDKILPPLPTLSASWAAVSKVLPKVQRRRSDQYNGPASPPLATPQLDENEILVVPREQQHGSPPVLSPLPLDLPSIPPVWQNPDGRRHSAVKSQANTNDEAISPPAQDDEPLPPASPVSRLSRSLSASTRAKIRTLIRYGSESVLNRAHFSTKRNPQTQSNPASEPQQDEPESDEERVPQTKFAPNPPSVVSSARVVTGSRFFESPSICSPGTELPSTGRNQTNRSAPLSRIGKFKTMTRKYSLALHLRPKKVEAR